MKNDEPQAPIPIVDNAHAPEFFSVGAAGSLVNQGNIHLTLVSPHGIYGAPQQGVAHVVNLRLVMPLAAAEHFANYIIDQINKQLDRQASLPPPSSDRKH